MDRKENEILLAGAAATEGFAEEKGERENLGIRI
jgi:hypothetical protein